MKKPHICISLHNLEAGGGIQERRVMLANAWSDLGYKVTILCPIRPKTQVAGLSSKVDVLYYGWWPNRSRYNMIFCIPYLAREFRKMRDVSVILAGEPSHILITSLALIISKNNAPLYGTVHGSLNYVGGVKQIFVSIASKLWLRISQHRVAAFAGVCNDVADQVSKALNRINVITLYNPVIDQSVENKFSMADNLTFPDRRPQFKFVVAIGRLHHQKGFDLLLSSLAKTTNLFLFVVGEGNDRSKLEKFAVESGVSDRVEFVGYTPNVFHYLKYAHCFAFSSRWEGFGNVLVESLYCGVPIVSFDCPSGPREILDHGKYGHLVPCYDTDIFAEKLQAASDCGINVNDRWKMFSVSSAAESYLKFMGLSGIADPNAGCALDPVT